MRDILALILSFSIVYLCFQIWKYKILPKLIEKSTKEIEKNPKWITSKADYYGFQDIDIILAENKFGRLPYFHIAKNDRFQLLIPTDVSTRDTDEIVRLALMGKVYIKYGLWFSDKPVSWLSMLCYMLDGNDIYPVEKYKNSQETS